MKKLKNSFPLLLILSLIIAAMASLGSAYASPIATLSVIFPNGTSSSNGEYFPTDTFTVKINVTDTTELFGFDFTLKYDTSVLTATSVTIGDFLLPGYIKWHEDIDDTVGYVWYAASQSIFEEFGVSGDGTLATIEFTVDSLGGTILDLYDTKLSGPPPDANPIAHEVYDGSFANIGVPPIAEFTASDYTPSLGETVIFDASASYDADGTIIRYDWDFGDGTTATTIEPFTDYSYEMLGIYKVTLIVNDNDGTQGQTSADITVVPPILPKVDLAEWKAKPEHHHHDISKHGTINALYAQVQNLGDVSVTVKVSFTIYAGRGGAEVTSFETSTYTFGEGSYLEVHIFDTSTDVGEFDTNWGTGRFYVKVQCFYLDGTEWVGGKIKAFSFAVVP